MNTKTWKTSRHQRIRLANGKNGKTIILRNPTITKINLRGQPIEVMVGVEVSREGDEKAGYRQGVMVHEIVQVIQTTEIAKTTELFFSNKYAVLVTKEAIRCEEREETAKAGHLKAKLMASRRARGIDATKDREFVRAFTENKHGELQ